MHKKMNIRLMWLLLLSIEWIYFHLRNSYFIVNNLRLVIFGKVFSVLNYDIAMVINDRLHIVNLKINCEFRER